MERIKMSCQTFIQLVLFWALTACAHAQTQPLPEPPAPPPAAVEPAPAGPEAQVCLGPDALAELNALPRQENADTEGALRAMHEAWVRYVMQRCVASGCGFDVPTYEHMLLRARPAAASN